MASRTLQDSSHSTWIPNQLLQAILDKTCVLYAGAGFSLEAILPDSSKLPTGKGLGYRLALELHREGWLQNVPKDDQPFDFAALAEDYQTAFGRQRLILLLHEIFGAEGIKPGEAHYLAIKFFPIIVTTNYDPLFEHAAILQGRQPIVIRRDAQIAFSGVGNRPTIIKLHGDLDDPERIVITHEDYNRQPIPDGLREKLSTILSEKTGLFIGTGLADSDFQEIYFQVLDRLGNLKPRAFVVTPIPPEVSPYRKQWDLFRKRWEGRELQFLPGTAGVFLQQLNVQLRGKAADPTAVVTPRSGIIRGPQELMQAYHDHLAEQVSTVRIFGENEPRSLEKVFVELNIIEEYQRPIVHAEWQGLTDAQLQGQRDVFATEDGEIETEDGEIENNIKIQVGELEIIRGKGKRTIKPDELLRRRTHAIIVGAPGCGKTTILRYLTWKTLKDDKRFPVFVELKSITESFFYEAKGDLAELLFDRAVAGPLHPQQSEREHFKDLFFAYLRKGEVAIYLDGLDEVSAAGFFTDFCRSVNEFVRSNYRQNDIIISTRPYALQTRFEGLQEMEIAPLNSRQIKEFFMHYYGDDSSVKQFLQQLRWHRELHELTVVPFLLGVIVYLHRQKGEIVGERLELYRQIVQQLVIQLDREKQVERFQILDPDGSLKREFLKQLISERLFNHQFGKDIERFAFTGEDILNKAKRFCRPEINPYLLTADVKATPLLREIGADTYAFAHLTLQEYLAAVVLSERDECEQAFCRAYFNPTLAEMEVLPMTLGLVRQPDDLYTVLEQLPESLTFTNLRLRARSLAYTRRINQKHLMKLTKRLIEFINENKIEKSPYFDAVLHSFPVASGQSLDFFTHSLRMLLDSNDNDVRRRAAVVIAQIGGDWAVKMLLANLEDRDSYMRACAAWVLGKIGDKRAVKGLLTALNDKDSKVRWSASWALGDIGDERAIEGLLVSLTDRNRDVRASAAQALGKIGDERAVEGLLETLMDEDGDVSDRAAEALEVIGGEQVLKGLLNVLKYQWRLLQGHVAEAVEVIGGKQAVESLLNILKDEWSSFREHKTQFSARIGDEEWDDRIYEWMDDDDYDWMDYDEIDEMDDERDDERYDEIEAMSIIALPLLGESVIEALWEVSDWEEMESLLDALWSRLIYRSWPLDKVKSEHTVEELPDAWKDEWRLLRYRVADWFARRPAWYGKISFDQAVLYLSGFSIDEFHLLDKIVALWEASDKQSVEVLLSALKDENEIVREHAIEALTTIGGERTVVGLLEVLKTDEVGFVRRYATMALGKIGDGRAVEGLLAALRDEDREVRVSAAQSLGKISDEALNNGLVKALSHQDSFVRQKAAQVVGYYTTDKQVLATLQHLAANDPAEEVRTAACEAAEKYANKLRYFAE